MPTPLAAQVIDLARAATRVIQAGAITIPMSSQTLKIARLTSDPTASWHAENAAITDSTPGLDSVTLTAHTLTSVVKVSLELIEDAPNVGVVVQNAIAAAIAVELDRVTLYGSGTAPEPQGVKTTITGNSPSSRTCAPTLRSPAHPRSTSFVASGRSPVSSALDRLRWSYRSLDPAQPLFDEPGFESWRVMADLIDRNGATTVSAAPVIASTDLFILRPDLGPRCTTFGRAGDPIPAGLHT